MSARALGEWQQGEGGLCTAGQCPHIHIKPDVPFLDPLVLFQQQGYPR